MESENHEVHKLLNPEIESKAGLQGAARGCQEVPKKLEFHEIRLSFVWGRWSISGGGGYLCCRKVLNVTESDSGCLGSRQQPCLPNESLHREVQGSLCLPLLSQLWHIQ